MKTVWTSVAAAPSGTVATTAAIAAPIAPARTIRTEMRPLATGLSERPTIRSRSASSQSLERPTEAWPRSMAMPSRATRHGSSPMPTANTTVMSETATVGPGWVDPASAIAPATAPRRSRPGERAAESG